MAKITIPVYNNAIVNTTAVILYTAPVGGAIVNFVQLTAIGASVDTTYDFWKVETGNAKADKYLIAKDFKLGQVDVNESHHVPFGNWFLDQGDFIEIQFAGTGINVSVHVNVVEEAP